MSGWLTDPLVLARFVHYSACVLAAGTAAFAVLAGPVPGAKDAVRLSEYWRTLVCGGAAAAALSGAAWLVIVAAGIVGASVVDTVMTGGIWSVAWGTQFGLLAIGRIGLAVLLTLPIRHDRVRLALALALVALIAPAGHAGAQIGAEGWIHLAADTAHLFAAAAWLGGLPALAILLGLARRDPQTFGESARRITARFSWLGMTAVGTLLVTGIANSWFLLSEPSDLVTTVYGRVLTLKLVLFGTLIAIAAVNRFHLTPRLAEAGALRALRRNSVYELCLGGCVLFLVAILGILEPAGHHHENTAIPDDAAFVHIHTNIVMADVTIEPGRMGPADVRIHLAKEDFTDYAARSVHFELRPPEADLSPIARDAKSTGNALWTVSRIALPRAGIWTAVVTVRGSDGAIVVLDGPIVIAP